MLFSYGYHEGVTEVRNAVDEKGAARPEFLQDKRDDELQQLPEWTEIFVGKEAQQSG